MTETDMPEEIWLRRTHLDGKHFSAVRSESRLVKDRTPYRLKSTVDAERAADSKTIAALAGALKYVHTLMDPDILDNMEAACSVEQALSDNKARIAEANEAA